MKKFILIKMKTNLKRYMHPNVHSTTIYNSQDTKTNRPASHEYIKRMCYVYTQDCYSARRKNEIMPLEATWMDLGCQNTE